MGTGKTDRLKSAGSLVESNQVCTFRLLQTTSAVIVAGRRGKVMERVMEVIMMG